LISVSSDLAPPPARIRRSNRRLIASAVCFAIFAALATVVRQKPDLTADTSMTLRLQRRRHPHLTRVMSLVSWLGFRPQSLLLPAALVGGSWLLGRPRDARYLIGAWAASFVSYTTKRLVMRPRPGGTEIVVVDAGLRDSSFPSGHVLHYTVFWGFVCYIWSSAVRDTSARRIPIAIVGALISTVGISRVYLGHHWLTDVIASYSLGVGLLLSLIGLHTRAPKHRIH